MRGLADLRDYQHGALEFCQATPRGYLAAKAGAGKTAVGLAYMEHLLFDSFEAQAVLVVAPKRVVAQWGKEASRWTFGRHLKFSQYLGSRVEREKALARVLEGFANVLVVSFEFFPELVKEIRADQWPFGLVIFDEASRLRSGGRQGSVGWKAMNAVSRKTSSRILLMSGSPRPGTAHELFAPVMLLDHGRRLGQTLGAFRERFLEPDKFDRRSGQVYSWKLKWGMEEVLYDTVADLFFAVAPDLGLASVVIDRPVVLPLRVEQACKQLARDQIVELDELDVVAGSQGVVAGKLHQMSQGAVFDASGAWQELHREKLDELAQVLEEVDGPAVVCVWYEHDRARVLASIAGAVDITTEAGMEAALAGRVEVAVLHPASAGHGIDGLQDHFSAIVWFALPSSFELYDQANARVVRSGQKETVRIYRLVAVNGLVDQKIVARLAEKEAGQDRFYERLEGGA